MTIADALAIAAAVAEVCRPRRPGARSSAPPLVQGRPLAAWLPAADLATLLRAGDQPEAALRPRLPWPDALPDRGPRRIGPFSACASCGTGTWVTYGATACCLSCAQTALRAGTRSPFHTTRPRTEGDRPWVKRSDA